MHHQRQCYYFISVACNCNVRVHLGSMSESTFRTLPAIMHVGTKQYKEAHGKDTTGSGSNSSHHTGRDTAAGLQSQLHHLQPPSLLACWQLPSSSRHSYQCQAQLLAAWPATDALELPCSELPCCGSAATSFVILPHYNIVVCAFLAWHCCSKCTGASAQLLLHSCLYIFKYISFL